jgi:tetratricopeptide (TPR) repeat protein
MCWRSLLDVVKRGSLILFLTIFLTITMLLIQGCKNESENSINDIESQGKTIAERLLGGELKLDFNPQYVMTSLLGKKLNSNPVTDKFIERYNQAVKKYKRFPFEDNIIWIGRRLGYLYKFKEAISMFSKGIEIFPDSYRLLRHRGHRYITIREFDKAIEDLKKASKLISGVKLLVEPDGIPNALGIPLSNTQFNIWYHLGLAYYLKGEFENAANAYQECLNWCPNDDLKVAVRDWLYMTYRRLGEKDKADELLVFVREKVDLLENDSSHKRLLLYKGILTPNSLIEVPDTGIIDDITIATLGYGVANWYFYN